MCRAAPHAPQPAHRGPRPPRARSRLRAGCRCACRGAVQHHAARCAPTLPPIGDWRRFPRPPRSRVAAAAPPAAARSRSPRRATAAGGLTSRAGSRALTRLRAPLLRGSGAPSEVIEPGTPGASTLNLQPWLTTYDPDVRALSSATRVAPCACFTRVGCYYIRAGACARSPSCRLLMLPAPAAQAVCNDGTPGGYYFIEGARPAKRRASRSARSAPRRG